MMTIHFHFYDDCKISFEYYFSNGNTYVDIVKHDFFLFYKRYTITTRAISLHESPTRKFSKDQKRGPWYPLHIKRDLPYVKKDLLHQKRPIVYQKRLSIYQRRPIVYQKRPAIYQKRPTVPVYQKTPTKIRIYTRLAEILKKSALSSNDTVAWQEIAYAEFEFFFVVKSAKVAFFF